MREEAMIMGCETGSPYASEIEMLKKP